MVARANAAKSIIIFIRPLPAEHGLDRCPSRPGGKKISPSKIQVFSGA